MIVGLYCNTHLYLQSLDASNEMISTMKAKLTERNSECNELTTSLSQKEQLCSLLTTELQQVKGQLQIREGQMDDLENVHSIQKAQLKSETEKVTQLQTEVDKITESASRLQEELDEKIEKNQRLSAEIKEKARQTAENSDGETANHQMEVAQLREEIERLKSALSEGEAMEKSAEKQTEVVENMEQTAVLLQTSDPTDERWVTLTMISIISFDSHSHPYIHTYRLAIFVYGLKCDYFLLVNVMRSLHMQSMMV